MRIVCGQFHRREIMVLSVNVVGKHAPGAHVKRPSCHLVSLNKESPEIIRNNFWNNKWCKWSYLLRMDSWWRLCNTHCLFTLKTILIGYNGCYITVTLNLSSTSTINAERNILKQECIPVGCVPAACWPYAGVYFQVGCKKKKNPEKIQKKSPVPGLGGVWSGGVCSRGSVWSGGVCLVWGVSGLGGCLVPGGCLLPGGGVWYPSMHWGRHPPVNRMTDRYKNITLATTSLRPVINVLNTLDHHLIKYLRPLSNSFGAIRIIRKLDKEVTSGGIWSNRIWFDSSLLYHSSHIDREVTVQWSLLKVHSSLIFLIIILIILYFH